MTDEETVKRRDSDTVAGRKYRARAKAQNAARIRLREAHREEWDAYYRQEVERIFEAEGLGDPW